MTDFTKPKFKQEDAVLVDLRPWFPEPVPGQVHEVGEFSKDVKPGPEYQIEIGIQLTSLLRAGLFGVTVRPERVTADPRQTLPDDGTDDDYIPPEEMGDPFKCPFIDGRAAALNARYRDEVFSGDGVDLAAAATHNGEDQEL